MIVGETEVNQYRFFVAVAQNDIAGFDIAVKDAVTMEMLQRIHHLFEPDERLSLRKWGVTGVERIFEVYSINVLHYQILCAILTDKEVT